MLMFAELIINPTVSGSPQECFLRFRHLKIKNMSNDTLTVRINNVPFLVSPLDELTLLDFISALTAEKKFTYRLSFTTSGTDSLVYIYNYGV